jgi:hypothetical protein
METVKRMPVCRIWNKQQKEWLDTDCCPMCGLPKSQWKRRTDWLCCSKECTKKYSEEVIFIWQYWKEKAFIRDKFTCKNCGIQPLREYEFNSTYWNGNFAEFKKWQEQRSIFKEWKGTTAILFQPEALVGDHIEPISCGGEEYDLNNVQTLCVKCNKIKTREDMKKIALYRKKNPNQTELNISPSVN